MCHAEVKVEDNVTNLMAPIMPTSKSMTQSRKVDRLITQKSKLKSTMPIRWSDHAEVKVKVDGPISPKSKSIARSKSKSTPPIRLSDQAEDKVEVDMSRRSQSRSWSCQSCQRRSRWPVGLPPHPYTIITSPRSLTRPCHCPGCCLSMERTMMRNVWLDDLERIWGI